MNFPLANFERFCSRLRIPAKDHSGVYRMGALYSTQRYFLREVAAGLENDVHDFLILKGRQQGLTTICDALDLYWPQRYEGIQGLMVADDDENRKIRRDILRTMFYSLDPEFQRTVRADNDEFFAWSNNSRLMFAAAAAKQKGSKTKLGRGRGVSYIHADEFDAWTNPRAVMGLRASRSDRHPQRLYTWASTAQGHGVLWEAWRDHEHSPSTRRIFIGAWRHDLNRVERDQVSIWDAYAHEDPTEDERLWMRVVKERYDYDIPPEYLVWHRWKLATDMHGDEAMMAQEHPNVEEDAFQSFGHKFFRPALIRHLRQLAEGAPKPIGYRYEWDKWLDTTRIVRADPDHDSRIAVWEEPDPNGVYVVSCHPAYSSSATATDDVVQVWRAYPDKLVQAAEYVVKGGDLTAHCAWSLIHLAGSYKQNRPFADIYRIIDMEMTGLAVYQEVERVEKRGSSLSPRALQGRRDMQDMMGSVRHYLFRRPDSTGARYVYEWKSQPSFRPWVLNQLRDAVENDTVEIRSRPLIDELAGVRRGEDTEADAIGGGGGTSECRVIATAMAVEHWLATVVPEIEGRVPTKAEPLARRHVGEVLIANWLDTVRTTGGRLR